MKRVQDSSDQSQRGFGGEHRAGVGDRQLQFQCAPDLPGDRQLQFQCAPWQVGGRPGWLDEIEDDDGYFHFFWSTRPPVLGPLRKKARVQAVWRASMGRPRPVR